MTLISDSEMLALQGLAESGMQTVTKIFHHTTVTTSNGQASSWSATPLTVLGWLKELTPADRAFTNIAGAAGLAETHVLRVPVGTAIASGDKVVIGASEFIVQSITNEDTYLPWVRANMRTLAQ